MVQENPAPPVNTPNPNPPLEDKKSDDVPIINLGDQLKPSPPIKPEPNPPTKKPDDKSAKKASQKPARVEEIRSMVLESKQWIHSKTSEIGDRVFFTLVENVSSNLSKGVLVGGKITAIEKIKKDSPGILQAQLDMIFTGNGGSTPLNATFKISKEKDQEGTVGKEIFISPGSQHKVQLTSKATLRGVYRPLRLPPSKGSLIGLLDINPMEFKVKLSDLKAPSRFEVYLEPPKGMTVEDLQDASFKLTRVNDFYFSTPLLPSNEKIRVADHNKNQIQELKYTFNGWDLLKYLPAGHSKLTFSALTKKGKIVEGSANVNVEYR